MSRMHAGWWRLPRRSTGSPPLTLPGTRSKSPAHAWDINAGTAVNEIRRPADFAAPSDLSLATYLCLVDPAPRGGPGAERRHDPSGVVARRRRFRARRLSGRRRFSRLLARVPAAVRLDGVAVLPSVQRDPASRLGYRPWPRPQIHLPRWLVGRRWDRRADLDRLDCRNLQLGLLKWRQRGCARRSAAQSAWARQRRASKIGGFSASLRSRWCR